MHFHDFAVLIQLSRDFASANFPVWVKVKSFTAIHFFAHFRYYHGFRYSAPLSYTGKISESLEHSFNNFHSQISPKMKISDGNKYKLDSCKGSKPKNSLKCTKENIYFS